MNEQLPGSLTFIDIFDRENGYSQDVFTGSWRNRQVAAFTYSFTETTLGGGRYPLRQSLQTVSVVALAVEHPQIPGQQASFPELTISRRGTPKWLAKMFTSRDLACGTAEFLATFSIASDHEWFAQAVCSPAMMYYLLDAAPADSIEIERDVIVDIEVGGLELESIEPRLEHLSNIANRIPPQVH